MVDLAIIGTGATMLPPWPRLDGFGVETSWLQVMANRLSTLDGYMPCYGRNSRQLLK
jgi:hypothetical protein